uniref:SMI1/KNR4 family protein n=1 Tax=Pedobacter schmidteae TaxID=2201271 RepID=UPI000EAD499B|nr:SMI1/KNR4 family protein [Pedobacter schmidteae]
MENITMPITSIGEPDWIEKLTTFLESYDVEVEGLEDFESAFELPEQVMEYYRHFGGIESSDFMYNLYKPEQLIGLSQSQWSFVKENFTDTQMQPYIVFSESPGNDPVCFDKHDFSIWLFSHDPLRKAKVFEDFNQYLQYEMIELQKLMGDVDFADDEEEMRYHQENLSGNDIDFDFRRMKFL